MHLEMRGRRYRVAIYLSTRKARPRLSAAPREGAVQLSIRKARPRFSAAPREGAVQLSIREALP